jgi:S-disulfanyl-L-cysteine oxidoreductase SoxD
MSRDTSFEEKMMKRGFLLWVALMMGCMQRETRADGAMQQETFTEQAEKGRRIFADSCSRCHGEQGEGTKKAPRLIGLSDGALPLNPPPDGKERRGQFHTAQEVGMYAFKYMPPLETGSLTEDAFWRVTAYLLQQNGVDLGSQHLDRSVAQTVELPRPSITSQR